MKYNVLGFSQEKLVKLNLTTDHALLLRYFVDFQKSGKMRKEIKNGKTYYWVKYEGVLNNFPILKSVDRIYRHLKDMVKLGILDNITIIWDKLKSK